MDEVGDFIWGLLGAVLVLVIVAVFVGTVANTGVAPQPGDPFFHAWLDMTRYGWQALVWIIPGVGAAAYVVLKLVEDASGF
jgi:molybdopterin biosynthesis enzyme